MICVLTLFGEVDLQETLRKRLQSNDIYFIEDNCTTSVQLTTQVEERCKEVDAVILAVGHSARDIYEVLLAHNVELIPKDFAVSLY